MTAEGLVVERGKTVDVPFQMEIGKYEEQIIVTAETVMMDTRSSTISTTFSDKLLAKVPTSRNPFYDLALTAPGMGSVGAEGSWLPSPTAYGSANSQNITLVNGVNTTNPRGSSWGSMVAVNYDTVEEVKVLSLGAKAEYGNYSGAAIDVITKSGGNEFHGDVAYYTQIGNAADNSTTSFSKSWLFADPTLQINSDPISNKEPSVTLGGPIMKDKLWFYAGWSAPKSEGHEPLYTLNTKSESQHLRPQADCRVRGQPPCLAGAPLRRGERVQHHLGLRVGPQHVLQHEDPELLAPVPVPVGGEPHRHPQLQVPGV